MESLKVADKTVNMPVLALMIIMTLVQIVSTSYVGSIKTDTNIPTEKQLSEQAEMKKQQKEMLDLLHDIKASQQAQAEMNRNTDRRLLNIEDEVKYIRQNYQLKPNR